MRTKGKLKLAICEAVDRRRGEIEKIGDQIMQNPGLGFKEFKTARLVADIVKSRDIPHQTGLAITGVKGVIRGKNPAPTSAQMGNSAFYETVRLTSQGYAHREESVAL